MAMLGTGKQALAQVAAVCAVRPIETVYVWSPSAENRSRFANRVAEAAPGLDIRVADSARAATITADVVTTATRARSPFLELDDLAPGAHVNAVGAITPERAELARDIVAKADQIVVDSAAAARHLSFELLDLFGDDEAGWSRVAELGTFMADGLGTASSERLTVFKALGLGLFDVALGEHIYHLALEGSVGSALETPTRAKPRLFTSNIPN